MRWKLSLFIILGIIANCSTLSRKQNLPPSHVTAFRTPASNDEEAISRDAYFENFKKENPDSYSTSWAIYNQGLLWKGRQNEKACGYFKTLSENQDFALKAVAALRAIEVCPFTEKSWADLEELKKTEWLVPSIVEVSFQHAKNSQNELKIMDLTFEKSFHSDVHKEKVELVQQAIEMAESLDDKEALTKYTARLRLLAPRFIPDPPPDEWFKVASDFRKVRQFKEARRIYDRVLRNKRSSKEDKARALDGIRLSYKQEGDKETHLRFTRKLADYNERLVGREKKNNQRLIAHFESQVLLARTLWTEGKVSEAKRTLEKLEKKTANKTNFAEIYWLRSRMEEEGGQLADALKWNKQALNQIGEDQAQWESLVWQQAWLLRKTKNYKDSVAKFEELKNKFANSSSSAKYSFWLARVLKESEDEVRAHLEFQRLTQEDPLGYYGIMAQRELGLAFEPLKTESIPVLEQPSFIGDEEYSQMMWLVSLGETAIARELLNRSVDPSKTSKVKDEDRKRIVKFQARLGNYLSLFEQLGQWEHTEKRAVLDQAPELIFPRPYQEQVFEAAKKSQVPSELIYSIMRQESAFNPRARSPVDAFGLMQLTPGTVNTIPFFQDVGYKEPDDLYEPSVNIALGTGHLRELLKRWKQQFILTVASYNASEKAVLGWIDTRFQSDPVEFIEEIPYAETQGYVKLVLRNYVFYLRLNSQGAQVAFPEQWLEGLQAFKK